MLLGQDNGFSGFVKKAILFGAVVVGLPMVALGVATLFRRDQQVPAPLRPNDASSPTEAQQEPAEEAPEAPSEAEAQETPEAPPEPQPEESPEAQPEPEAEMAAAAELRKAVADTMRLLYSERTVDDEPSELSLRDRRQSVRLRCELSVSCADGEASTHVATLIDLGLTGLHIRSPHAYKVGDVWRIAPADQEPIDALVVWCIRGESDTSRAGLKFAESLDSLCRSWVVDCLLELGLRQEQLQQRRAWVRIQTPGMEVQIKTPKDKELTGRLLDIGVGGARLETPRKLPSKGQSRLVLPGGSGRGSLSVPATVLESNKHPERKCYITRLRFTSLNKGLSTRLENLLLDLLKTSSEA